MLLEEMRQKVVDYGNQLISSGLTIGTAGQYCGQQTHTFQ